MLPSPSNRFLDIWIVVHFKSLRAELCNPLLKAPHKLKDDPYMYREKFDGETALGDMIGSTLPTVLSASSRGQLQARMRGWGWGGQSQPGKWTENKLVSLVMRWQWRRGS